MNGRYMVVYTRTYVQSHVSTIPVHARGFNMRMHSHVHTYIHTYVRKEKRMGNLVLTHFHCTLNDQRRLP